MKNFRFIVVFFGAIFLMMEINAIATSDKTFKEGKDSWLQHDYQAAYDKLSLYWDQPFGKTVEVAYMLGTSGCRLKGKMLWGKSFLEKTLYD